jgi:hypothetical protein
VFLGDCRLLAQELLLILKLRLILKLPLIPTMSQWKEQPLRWQAEEPVSQQGLLQR